MTKIGRRKFIGFIGGLVGLVTLGRFAQSSFSMPEKDVPVSEEFPLKAPSSDSVKQVADGFGTTANPDKRFVMVIDVGACIGCRTCMWGCKEENNIPDTISPLWIEVFELKSATSVTGHPSVGDLQSGVTTSYKEAPLEGRWYMPAQCNHCENPPCVKVCPTGATSKKADGLVLMDYDRCIGCRLCVVACPYSARRVNWQMPKLPADKVNPLVPLRPVGVVEKCTFCAHRTRRGELPRCVEVCPVRARHFGDIKNPNSEVSKILNSNQSFRLLEEIGTDPHIWYITRGKKWTQ